GERLRPVVAGAQEVAAAQPAPRRELLAAVDADRHRLAEAVTPDAPPAAAPDELHRLADREARLADVVAVRDHRELRRRREPVQVERAGVARVVGLGPGEGGLR